jgi:hypothetical protein
MDPLTEWSSCTRAVQDHDLIVEIARLVRRRVPRATLIVVENSQAVTSFAAASLGDLFPHVDTCWGLVRTGPALSRRARDAAPDLDGPARRDPSSSWLQPQRPRLRRVDLDARRRRWERFPSRTTGRCGGPRPVSDRYLTVLRRAAARIHLCVVPDMTGRRWRGKSPIPFVDELETLAQRFGVSEFHFEDVNATVARKR